jgi:uncharacterized protein YbjQ (UPF0145 family)
VPLFRRGPVSGPDSDSVQAAAAEQQASIEQLLRGGLPTRAEQRLRETSNDLFTTDLSVNQFALAAPSAVRPLTQVMGSSVYHVGWQRTPGGWSWQAGSQELSVLSDAWNEARRLAFGRLSQEAALAGAHAVVGMKVTTGAHDWLAGAVEYVAFGTAVRVEGIDAAEPVLTDLSLQEYWQLRRAGYRPVGLFGSSGVFYVVSSWGQQRSLGWGGWANQELHDFTQGLYDAREVTIGRVTAQARASHADGLVGVSLKYDVREVEVDRGGGNRTDLMITMHVLGTAIAQEEPATEQPLRVAVDLSADRKPNHVLGGMR